MAQNFEWECVSLWASPHTCPQFQPKGPNNYLLVRAQVWSDLLLRDIPAFYRSPLIDISLAVIFFIQIRSAVPDTGCGDRIASRVVGAFLIGTGAQKGTSLHLPRCLVLFNFCNLHDYILIDHERAWTREKTFPLRPVFCLHREFWKTERRSDPSNPFLALPKVSFSRGIEMQPDGPPLPFLSFPPNHRPTWNPSVHFDPQITTLHSSHHTQQPYFNTQYSSEISAMLDPNTPGPPQKSKYNPLLDPDPSSPISYPESSQRTPLDDTSYPLSYDYIVGSGERREIARGVMPDRTQNHQLATVDTGQHGFSHRRYGTKMPNRQTTSPTQDGSPSMSILSDGRYLQSSSSGAHHSDIAISQSMDLSADTPLYPQGTSSNEVTSRFMMNEFHAQATLPAGSTSRMSALTDQPNSTTLTFQMQSSSIDPVSNYETQQLVSPSENSSDDSGRPFGHRDNPDHILNLGAQTQALSSIPMRNSGWPQAALNIALNARSPEFVATHEQSNSPGCTTSESESSTSIYPPEACPSYSPGDVRHSSSTTRRPKKKSKMHECDICHKMFPRPSGLRTHMNTHTDTKPFPCSFPNCHKRFAVRSNAKRHLRTHGVLPSSMIEPEHPSYVVGFSTPTVLPESEHQLAKVPIKLRWIPHSLATRTNVAMLRSSSDPDSESEDGDHDAEDSSTSLSPVLTIPLRAVVPSLPTADPDDHHEERNSYLEAGSHPYHTTQFRGLPGPAIAVTRSLAVV